GFASYLDPNQTRTGTAALIHQVEVFVGVFIGAITFTGSLIAFAKLQGTISGKPLILPARHLLNIAMVIACVILGAQFVGVEDHAAVQPLLIMTAIASVIGIHLVMAIGGADMPVVVSRVHSRSRWGGAAAGFMRSDGPRTAPGAPGGARRPLPTR